MSKFKAFMTVLGLIMAIGIWPQTGFGETNKLSVQEIRAKGKSFLESQLAWQPDEMEVDVKYTGKAITLPEGEPDFKFKLLGHRRPVGRVAFSMSVSVKDQEVRKIWLTGNVKVYYSVIQARRPIPAKTMITAEDVELIRVSSITPLRNIVSDPEKVIGFKATQNLETGQNVAPHMVIRPPLVKRGDRILLIAERGPLRITTPGKAQDNGFKDAMVPVKNLQTKKTVYGIVIDAHTVKVDF